MWTGLMQKQCVNIELGYAYSFSNYTTMCTTDLDCYDSISIGIGVNPGSSFACSKTNINPFNGVASFDDFLHSLNVVFIIITMEGWTDYFAFVSKTFKGEIYINKIIIFLWFHVFIFLGGYYLMNLFLAVVWSSFSKMEQEKKKNPHLNKKNLSKLIIREIKKQEKKEINETDKFKNLTDEQKVELIREKYAFIEKDPSQIPLKFKTLDDLRFIETKTPKELYFLNKRIEIEAQRAEEDFEKEIQKLKESSEGFLKKETNETINQITPILTATSIEIREKYVEEAIKSTLIQWEILINLSESAESNYQLAKYLRTKKKCRKSITNRLLSNRSLISRDKFSSPKIGRLKGIFESMETMDQALVDKQLKLLMEENNEYSIDPNFMENSQRYLYFFYKNISQNINYIDTNEENPSNKIAFKESKIERIHLDEKNNVIQSIFVEKPKHKTFISRHENEFNNKNTNNNDDITNINILNQEPNVKEFKNDIKSAKNYFNKIGVDKLTKNFVDFNQELILCNKIKNNPNYMDLEISNCGLEKNKSDENHSILNYSNNKSLSIKNENKNFDFEKSICTKNQPRRPILRPFREGFAEGGFKINRTNRQKSVKENKFKYPEVKRISNVNRISQIIEDETQKKEKVKSKILYINLSGINTEIN